MKLWAEEYSFLLTKRSGGGVVLGYMKKYILFSFAFILSLILLGSVSVKSANAANCAPGDLFNSVTGQACSATTMPTACAPGDLFNILTGQTCSGTTTSTNSSAVSQFNNLFKSNFQVGLRGSSDVSALQQFLKDQGYYFGKIDGSYGRITARAVSDFKGDNNLGNTIMPTAILTPTPTSISQPTQTYQTPISTYQAPVTNSQTLLPAPTQTLSITTPSLLPNATVGQLYSVTLNTSGIDPNNGYNWSVDNGFPLSGLSFGPSTTKSFINISGIPGSAGTSTFNVTVNSSPSTVTKQFTLTVNPATVAPTQTLTITTPSQLPTATVGQYYFASLGVTGGSGNYNWSLNNNAAAFPVNGLGFSQSNTQSPYSGNAILGTPASNTNGTYTFTVNVASGSQTVSKQFTLTVDSQ